MANVMDGIAFDSYCIHYDAEVQFTALSGRHSVLERPLSGENGRPFLVITPEIIGY